MGEVGAGGDVGEWDRAGDSAGGSRDLRFGELPRVGGGKRKESLRLSKGDRGLDSWTIAVEGADGCTFDVMAD